MQGSNWLDVHACLPYTKPSQDSSKNEHPLIVKTDITTALTVHYSV